MPLKGLLYGRSVAKDDGLPAIAPSVHKSGNSVVLIWQIEAAKSAGATDKAIIMSF
jgi:hypothetical protein